MFLAIASFAIGCSGGTPINPGTKVVELRVIRILTSGDTEGSPSNQGCRFDDAEISSIMNKTISYGTVFGSQTKLMWNGNVLDITLNDQFVFRLEDSTLDFSSLEAGLIAHDGLALPKPNFVNIYFVGCYTDEGVNVLGLTADPEGNPLFPPGTIYLNDQGFPTIFGATDLDLYIDSPILLHEMGHYLGRFFDRTLGTFPTESIYDDGGHPTNRSVGHLMRADVALGTYEDSAFLPGDEYKDGQNASCHAELGEISRRICMGTWNTSQPLRCP